MSVGIVKSLYPPPPDLPPLNYYSLVFEKLAGNVPQDFVVQIDGITGEKRTYKEVIERVRDCATALGASIEDGGLGLGRDNLHQDIVMIFSPNSLDYAVLVFAALAIAVPFCCLPANPTKGELIYLLQKVKAGPKPTRLHLFVHPSLIKLALDGAKESGISAKNIYYLGEGHTGHPSVSSMIESVRTKGPTRQPVSPAQKDTLAYLVFSSGTSGLPKAVMVSHGNLCFALMQYITTDKSDDQVTGPPRDDAPKLTCLASLPLYHSYGLHFFALRGLVTPPRTMVLLPKWNLEQALDTIQKYKVNFLAAVPSIIHQLAYSPKVAEADLSSLTLVGTGAAYLSPEVANIFLKNVGNSETSTVIAEGYGLSEATIGSMMRPQPGQFGLPWDRASTGILISGQEARIVRDDGSDANVNEPGELWLKGGNITMGYWGDEKATMETFTSDGWLRTGDRFRVNELGMFYFEDRAKDTLKVSGAQVAPSEIERVLLSHPEGLAIDAAVAGVPSRSKRDEKQPRAWIVLGPRGKELGDTASAEKLDAWVKEQLSRFKWLTGGIEVVSEVPKNPTGKVLRRVLVERYVKSKGWLSKL